MEQTEQSFFKSFFSFNLTILSGIIVALIIHFFSSETRPIWSFLFSPSVYVITSMVAITIRLFLWLTIDKGTMFVLGKVIKKAIQDVIIINVVVLSTLSFIFLISIALA